MMQTYRRAPPDSKNFKKLNMSFIGKDFKLKFIFFALTATFGSLCLFFIPISLFNYQNYANFKTLAYELHPQILKNLENEIIWLMFFASFSFLSILAFVGFWTYKMTHDLTGTIFKVQSHTEKIMQGDWSAEFEVADDANLRQYLKNYEAFIHYLKVETQLELEFLKTLAIDPRHRDAHKAWAQLIETKEKRLGVNKGAGLKLISGDDALSGEADFERLVS